MQAQCSFWDAGSREENNVSANTFFSEASERIFSENVGKESDVFLLILTHSPVRNCQVGLWRTPISEFSLLHQPCWEQAVLELGTLGLPDSLPQSRGSCGLSSEEELCSQLCAERVAWVSALAQGWLLRGLRRFTAAVMQPTSCSSQGCQRHFPPAWSTEGIPGILCSGGDCCNKYDLQVLPWAGWQSFQDGGHSAALRPARLPRETPRAMAARAPFSIVKKPAAVFWLFLSVFFKSFCSKN